MGEYKIAFGKDFDVMLGELNSTLSRQKRSASTPDIIKKAVALYHYLNQRVVTIPGRVAIINTNNEIIEIIDPLP